MPAVLLPSADATLPSASVGAVLLDSRQPHNNRLAVGLADSTVVLPSIMRGLLRVAETRPLPRSVVVVVVVLEVVVCQLLIRELRAVWVWGVRESKLAHQFYIRTYKDLYNKVSSVSILARIYAKLR